MVPAHGAGIRHGRQFDRKESARVTAHAKHFRLVQSLGDDHIGLEARAQLDDHMETRIWLRLLACSTQIEHQIRQLLRTRFATSLPRFDYLAQLDRHPDGLRMNVLSRYLMVTGGNVTGLTDQLEKEGLVKREADPDDRRSFRVRLTPAGRGHFATMAAEHERWLIGMFDGLGAANKDALYAQLGSLRVHLARRETELSEPDALDEPVSSTRSRP